MTSSPVSKKVSFNPPSSSPSESNENSLPSSPNLDSTFKDFEIFEYSKKAENQSAVLHIPCTTKTHSHCLLCSKAKVGLETVSEALQIDFLIKYGIWISDGSRLCSNYYNADKSVKS